jgi:hypothetical protein
MQATTVYQPWALLCRETIMPKTMKTDSQCRTQENKPKVEDLRTSKEPESGLVDKLTNLINLIEYKVSNE